MQRQVAEFRLAAAIDYKAPPMMGNPVDIRFVVVEKD
jgi:hypothetical protein